MFRQVIESIGPWAYATSIAEWIRTTNWGVPILSVVHVFGLIFLLGSVFMTSLRCFGLAWRRDAVRTVFRTFAPVTLGGLAMMIVSGSLLFASGADRYAPSNTFQFKMMALTVAIIVQSAVYVDAVRDRGNDRLVT